MNGAPSSGTPAGPSWHADPLAPLQLRWWTGAHWSSWVVTLGATRPVIDWQSDLARLAPPDAADIPIRWSAAEDRIQWLAPAASMLATGLAPARTVVGAGVLSGPPMPPPSVLARHGLQGGDLGGRAVKGFAWASFASIASKGIVFLMTLVLAHLLMPKDFGVVAAALTAITYLEIGLDLGVGEALVYEQERGVTIRARSAFTLNLVVSLVFAGVFYLASPGLARFFHVAADVGIFRALSAYIVVRGAGQVHDAILRRDLDFRRVTSVEFVRSGTRGALTVALAIAGLGAWSLAIGLIIGETLATMRLWTIVHVVPTLRAEREVLGSLLRYGLGILTVQMVSQIGVNADYLVVGSVLGATQLGLYTIAFRIPELAINNTLTIFSTVAFPTFSSAREQRRGDLRTVMLRTLSLTTLFGLTTGVGLALASRDFVHVLFGPNWDPAAAPMAVISLVLGVAACGYGSGDLLKSLGKLRTLTWMTGLSACISVTGFILVVHHGITAVAYCHLAAAAVLAVIFIRVSAKLVRATARDVARSLRPSLAAATGVLAFALPFRLLLPTGPVALVVIVGAGILGAGLGLLAGDRSMFHELRDLAARLRG